MSSAVQQGPGLWLNVGAGNAAELTTNVVERGKPLFVVVE